MKEKINAKVGETFKIGGYELIRFKDTQGGVAVVFKDILFTSEYGENNNLAKSKILKRLNGEILPMLEKLIGTENILEFDIDLTSLDGSKKHGTMRSRISLPTFDFYRNNVSVFDRYNPERWWWLATPDTTTEHYNDNWIVCVSPRGDIYYDGYDYDRFGVRPFLIFSSSIFVSYEEKNGRE